MAVVQIKGSPNAPFAGQTKDTVSSTTGRTNLTITFVLTGTVSQLVADWAALIATTITADASAVYWGGGEL